MAEGCGWILEQTKVEVYIVGGGATLTDSCQSRAVSGQQVDQLWQEDDHQVEFY